MSLVIDLIDLVAKHKAGELRCPATALITFISRINYRFWISRPSISIYLGYFVIYEQFKFHAQLS